MNLDVAAAARDGDLHRVRALLEQGADPNSSDEQHRRAIAWAAAHGNVEIVELLLAAGADPDLPAPDGTTALELACKTGNARVAEVLLAADVEADTRSDAGSTPLTCAVSAGAMDIVQLLLEARVSVDTPGPGGGSPLLFAAQAGRLEMVDLLLRHGADPDVRSESGLTALMQAASIGDPRIVERLLEHGATADIALDYGATARIMALSGAQLEPSRKAEFEVIAELLAEHEGGWDTSVEALEGDGEARVSDRSVPRSLLQVLGIVAAAWGVGLVCMLALGLVNLLLHFALGVPYLPGLFLRSELSVALTVLIGPFVSGGIVAALGGGVWLLASLADASSAEQVAAADRLRRREKLFDRDLRGFNPYYAGAYFLSASGGGLVMMALPWFSTTNGFVEGSGFLVSLPVHLGCAGLFGLLAARVSNSLMPFAWTGLFVPVMVVGRLAIDAVDSAFFGVGDLSVFSGLPTPALSVGGSVVYGFLFLVGPMGTAMLYGVRPLSLMFGATAGVLLATVVMTMVWQVVTYSELSYLNSFVPPFIVGPIFGYLMYLAALATELNPQRIAVFHARAEEAAKLPEVDLVRLVHDGFALARGTGQSITAIRGEIVNLTPSTFTVSVRTGTYFVSTGEHQNMASRAHYRFQLGPEERYEIEIEATCINAGQPIPGADNEFRGVSVVNDDVARFLDAASGANPMAIQAGVWALTDQYTAEQVQSRLVSTGSLGVVRTAVSDADIAAARRILDGLGIQHRL